MIRLVFASFLTIFVSVLAACIGYTAYTDPLSLLAVICVLVGLIAIAIGGIALGNYMKGRKPSQSLVAQKYRSYKSKICPSVDYES